MTPSPRHLRKQVQEVVSDLPIHAARFAVMGVGRALLLTDRVRKDVKDLRESGPAPVLGRLRGDAEHFTAQVVEKVGRLTGGERDEEEAEVTPQPRRTSPLAADSEISVGKPTSNGAKPTAAEAKAGAAPVAKAVTKPAKPRVTPKPDSKPTPAEAKAGAAPVAKAVTKAAPKKDTAEAERQAKARDKAAAGKLPVPDYDDATLASVRARLRGLTSKQVGQLREYEREHQARAEFLRMYENRIAKLNDRH